MEKLEVLKTYFGYDSFRSGQEDVIDAIFDETIRGILVVMPTGQGKSLLYQLPAIMLPHMTLVISPLIALMKDQVDYLKSKGVSAEFFNSSLDQDEKDDITQRLREDKIKVLFVAPERFEDSSFVEILKDNNISLLAIDEAHCVSMWGHDFRPSYRKIKRAIFDLKPQQVIALTATATKKVQQDICNQLGAPNAKKFIKGFFRPDLKIRVVKASGSRFDDIVDEVVRYNSEGIKTGIVYVGKRKDAEEIMGTLKDRHDIDAMFYHAGMNEEDRTSTQDKWFKNGGIIIATIAFGMGMNKPDVRFVLHAYLPNSIEDYYQQIGRASRDGLGADCKLYVNMWEDTNFLNWMIDTSAPPVDTVQAFWKYVNNKAKDNKGVIRQTQEAMASSAGIKPTMVGGCVGVLKRNNLMKTVERGLYEVNYYENYLEANINYDALKALRKSKQDKMFEIVDFVNDTKTCRMTKILDYFDENGSMPCGKCDICIDKNRLATRKLPPGVVIRR